MMKGTEKQDILKEIQAKLPLLSESKANFLKNSVATRNYEMINGMPHIVLFKMVSNSDFLEALDKLQDDGIHDGRHTDYNADIQKSYNKLFLSCSDTVRNIIVNWMETTTVCEMFADVRSLRDKAQRMQQRLEDKILPLIKGAGPDVHVVDIVERDGNPKMATIFLTNFKEESVDLPLAVLNSAYPELTQSFMVASNTPKRVKPH
jgi:hypothetical protein